MLKIDFVLLRLGDLASALLKFARISNMGHDRDSLVQSIVAIHRPLLVIMGPL